MIRIILFVFLVSVFNESKSFPLSERARISILTCSPGNEVYSVYGHTAIRVKDDRRNYDAAYNYGIFDFSAPNFLYRFASGQTDYLLRAYSFHDFVDDYRKERRSVYEQVLDLSQEEKQKIFDFLIWNARPENRVYRYNFFFDNCATRVRDVIANEVSGGLSFEEEGRKPATLRRLVRDYHGKLLWTSFGIDFVVASESDREATLWEEMFLPDYLMEHFANAIRKEGGGKIVQSTHTVYQAPDTEFVSNKLKGPFVVFFLLTILVMYFSLRQFRKRHMRTGLDYLVYGFVGFMGVVMGWFVLFSEHPAMSPNYNLLWAVPLNLLFVIAYLVKKWRPVLNFYHLFISAWLILFMAFSTFVPQAFHPVFYLFVLMVISRSLPHSLILIRKRQKAS